MLHLLEKVCNHMNTKDATVRSTQGVIDTLITEQWVSFHLENVACVNQAAGIPCLMIIAQIVAFCRTPITFPYNYVKPKSWPKFRPEALKGVYTHACFQWNQLKSWPQFRPASKKAQRYPFLWRYFKF